MLFKYFLVIGSSHAYLGSNYHNLVEKCKDLNHSSCIDKNEEWCKSVGKNHQQWALSSCLTNAIPKFTANCCQTCCEILDFDGEVESTSLANTSLEPTTSDFFNLNELTEALPETEEPDSKETDTTESAIETTSKAIETPNPIDPIIDEVETESPTTAKFLDTTKSSVTDSQKVVDPTTQVDTTTAVTSTTTSEMLFTKSKAETRKSDETPNPVDPTTVEEMLFTKTTTDQIEATEQVPVSIQTTENDDFNVYEGGSGDETDNDDLSGDDDVAPQKIEEFNEPIPTTNPTEFGGMIPQLDQVDDEYIIDN